MKDVSNRIDLLLDERLDGNVSDGMFKQLMAKYESEAERACFELVRTEGGTAVVRDDTENIKHLMERFKQCVYIEEPGQGYLCELIDFIWVFRKEKAGKGFRQKIGIHYNFVGELNGCDIMAYFDHITRNQKEKDQAAL